MSHGISLLSRRPVRQLFACSSGSVALIGGLALTTVLFVIAVALDVGRIHNTRTQLQAALDAAALAGAKALQEDNATQATVDTVAQATFDSFLANIKLPGITTTNFKAKADFNSDKVVATVDAQISSILSKVAPSSDYVNFKPTAAVSYKYEKIELALVVDVTGSMNWTPSGDTKPKLQSLKEAASTLIDTLMANSPAENAVRIAVAPFSASVNAGALANAVSASPDVTTCGYNWYWGYSCQTSAGADVDTCVIERPVSHEDADPTSDKIPAVPSASYGNYSCPKAPVVPLQGLSQQTTLKNTINSYVASGATAGHIGAAWGWYLLSDKWNSVLPTASRPEPISNKHVHKHVIFMTDGQFNTSYLSGSSTGSMQQTDESYAEFQELCKKMSNPGKGKITIWTIGFDLNGLGTTRPKDELIACSGATNFFDAPTGDALKAAFSTIVANMRSMAVSQ